MGWITSPSEQSVAPRPPAPGPRPRGAPKAPGSLCVNWLNIIWLTADLFGNLHHWRTMSTEQVLDPVAPCPHHSYMRHSRQGQTTATVATGGDARSQSCSHTVTVSVGGKWNEMLRNICCTNKRICVKYKRADKLREIKFSMWFHVFLAFWQTFSPPVQPTL